MELAKARGARIAPRQGGRVLADALVAQGITHAFTVPGESFLPVLDGLYAVRQKLHLTTCRFEAGAANMAEAYGKLTGRPAAAFVTRGPGACHAAIGVHVAFQDSTPLLLFVGQIPFGETDRESFQEVDYRRMFQPLAKWVTQIDDATRIPEIVAHAVDVATTGRPGPVVIALSEEMQQRVVEVTDLRPVQVARPHPDPAALERMLALLARARKPLAILGGSGWSEQGRADIRAFLTTNDLPVSVSFRRQALYDNTLDNYVGDLGVGSDPALVARAREADLILAIGTRLGEAVSQGYTLLDPVGGVPLVHVHPDAGEIGRVFRPALGIVTDLNVFAAAAARLPAVQPAWSEWRHDLRALRQAGREVPEYEGPLNLARVLRELEDLLEDDAILTCDAGNFATWPPRFMNFRDGQRFIGPTNGAMGYSVPAAIGAKIAFPGRQVVSFVGDGGFLMTGQELATAFHHGVAPIVLVFNNQMYGTIRMHQERAYPGRVSGTALTNPDFARLIEAFGGHGEVVAATAEFAPAFRRAVLSGRPALIELRMNPEQITTRATIAQLRAGATAASRPPAKPKVKRASAPKRAAAGVRAAPKKPKPKR
ncbi:Thiamine pyrophosphate-binding protein [Rhodovastum atsumiense]|uniref:Thiamine pyrophosphate-binding protein n=1 Tax=Rhodovastum atsumiense TaxID=504468 RepID=A0A5M6IVS9_9PROT|nr:thiamine pyrophosphate-dependent enzyme [Rhodovastum atsumiense]KAA5612039.1 thiamine pyrophosphate-binding protein [Rhodovastum atsumiense]CAH2604096.1 Thiamine pyrophosphate-binding protein [Rhodovastum atsumiense]